jgi:hypothetical protein
MRNKLGFVESGHFIMTELIRPQNFHILEPRADLGENHLTSTKLHKQSYWSQPVPRWYTESPLFASGRLYGRGTRSVCA